MGGGRAKAGVEFVCRRGRGRIGGGCKSNLVPPPPTAAPPPFDGKIPPLPNGEPPDPIDGAGLDQFLNPVENRNTAQRIGDSNPDDAVFLLDPLLRGGLESLSSELINPYSPLRLDVKIPERNDFRRRGEVLERQKK